MNAKLLADQERLLQVEKDNNLKLLTLLKALMKQNPNLLESIQVSQNKLDPNIYPPSSVSRIDLSNVKGMAGSWITKVNKPSA